MSNFFFSAKLNDELKENSEESKTQGTKRSHGSSDYRSSTLPRSYGVSFLAVEFFFVFYNNC